MNRALRNLAWFAVGVFLSAFLVIANAETIPATNQGSQAQYRIYYSANPDAGGFQWTAWFATGAAACASVGGTAGPQYCVAVVTGYPNGFTFAYGSGSNIVYTCPTGQNWTLSGQQCTRPDCVSPQVRNPNTGVCEAPKCTSKGTAMEDSSYFLPGGRPNAYICVGTCKAVQASFTCLGESKIISGIKRQKCNYKYDFTGGGNADECNPSPDGTVYGFPPYRPTTPESCKEGDVMVSGSGGVKGCVSAATGKEQSTAPPTSETKTSEKTQTTGADGKTTVTYNITNNNTGGTTTVTEVYGAGVTPGPGVIPQSATTSTTGGGASGETSGSKDGQGDGDKDHCEDNPDRAGCKTWDELVGTSPDPAAINTGDTNVAFTPASGFGSGSYSCPANSQFRLSVSGAMVDAVSWPLICNFAEGVKPVILAFAFLAAAMIGIGGAKD